MAHVEKSIEVQRPVDQVYAQWTQFEEFPEFMENVDEVRQLDDKHLEWKAKVAGIERRWKAEIVDQKPNKMIAWRSISGDQNDGKVEFQPIDGRTMVKLVVDYEPPAGNVGDDGATLMQVTPQNVGNKLKSIDDVILMAWSATGERKGGGEFVL